MIRLRWISLGAFVLATLVVSRAAADEISIGVELRAELLPDWRYHDLDRNGDGRVSRGELVSQKRWKHVHDDPELFLALDLDRDGGLSLSELRIHLHAEHERASRSELALVLELEKKHGKHLGNPHWLKAHPGLARGLFKNRTYLCLYPDVSITLLADRSFVAAHPDLVISLRTPNAWRKSHPRLSGHLKAIKGSGRTGASRKTEGRNSIRSEKHRSKPGKASRGGSSSRKGRGKGKS